MIQRRMVFIVGAGASVEYGLPLGSELISSIADGLTETGFLKRALLDAEFRVGDLEDFRARLLRSDLLSIDVFLEGNEAEYTRIGRAAIAGAILLREKDAASRVFDQPPDDHWLRYLWNVMKSQTDAVSFSDNEVAFVTFNYDRLIEYYFDTVIEHAFNLGAENAQALRHQSIRIVHLHGLIEGRRFGDFPGVLSGDLVAAMAEGVRVIHDSMPQNDPNFEAAYELISHADNVVLVGFGYHPTNIERLRLKPLTADGARVSGTVVGMGRAEIDMAKKRMGLNFESGGQHEKVEEFLRQRVHFE